MNTICDWATPILLAYFIASCLVGSASAQEPGAEASKKGKPELENRRQMQQEIERYEVSLQNDGQSAKLERLPNSLLAWSNPVVALAHGDVFVWTHEGRPEVIASVFRFESMGIEFQSLSSSPIETTYDGKSIWSPKEPGVVMETVPGAPAASKSAPARLIQMRAIARKFSAESIDRNDVTVRRRLRVLPNPVHRYKSPKAEVLDGAMFFFVQGTDPEIVLLLEARPVEESHAWHFALARQNSIDLRVSYQDREVWHAPKLAPPWPNVRDPRKPYLLITRAQASKDE